MILVGCNQRVADSNACLGKNGAAEEECVCNFAAQRVCSTMRSSLLTAKKTGQLSRDAPPLDGGAKRTSLACTLEMANLLHQNLDLASAHSSNT